MLLFVCRKYKVSASKSLQRSEFAVEINGGLKFRKSSKNCKGEKSINTDVQQYCPMCQYVSMESGDILGTHWVFCRHCGLETGVGAAEQKSNRQIKDRFRGGEESVQCISCCQRHLGASSIPAVTNPSFCSVKKNRRGV